MHVPAGALHVELRLDELELPWEGGQELRKLKRHRLTGNGKPIPGSEVMSIINLGHAERTYKPTLIAPDAAQATAGPSAAVPSDAAAGSSSPQDKSGRGKHVYGLYGHGMWMAIGKLAYCAFWQGT